VHIFSRLRGGLCFCEKVGTSEIYLLQHVLRLWITGLDRVLGSVRVEMDN